MTYIDGFISPLLPGRRADYEQHCREMAPIFHEYGALAMVENIGSADVPPGKQTDLWRAVAADQAAGESIIFSWVVWPSKEARDKGWEGLMADPRMQHMNDIPFDAKRMIFGGFETILDSSAG